MTEQEVNKFQELFSKYCKQEVKAGHCEPDTCDACPVNIAYDEIFRKQLVEEV